MPTGNARYQDRFIDRIDRTEALRYVDQSVQPGDGGWGLIVEGAGFWRVKRAFLFGSGSYLANPRDTNGTPSIIAVLGLPLNTGQFAGLGVNSVPDQYQARLGGTVPIWRGFSGTLAWRMEGLRRYDLFGDSHGWRRPGTAMFVEPGVSYSRGQHTFSFNLPVGYYFNRHRNPYTGTPGDATFPKHIFLSSYTMRLARRLQPQVQPPMPSGPTATTRPAEAARVASTSAAPTPATPFCLPAVFGR
jgi:hypothetical protein